MFANRLRRLRVDETRGEICRHLARIENILEVVGAGYRATARLAVYASFPVQRV